ncbi:MAG: hypothetical protein HY744_21320 [Deltaproteobacteria bacterium]|nr:hypothetical protein [Deltaproteobacteria bacterium]
MADESSKVGVKSGEVIAQKYRVVRVLGVAPVLGPGLAGGRVTLDW